MDDTPKIIPVSGVFLKRPYLVNAQVVDFGSLSLDFTCLLLAVGDASTGKKDASMQYIGLTLMHDVDPA